MSARDYLRLKRTPAFTHGMVVLAGEPTSFSNVDGLVHSIREIFLDEVYRFASPTKTPHIVDAGANIGLSVRYFKRLHPQSTVVAFEPDVEIYPLLVRNVGTMPGVELHEAAAWTEDGELTFFSEGSLAGSSEIDFARKGKKIVVKAERLKDQLQRRVDFLKIDIEGAENAVLFDLEDELSNVGALFFEYHSQPGRPQRLGELLDLVQRAGFRYSINGAHGASHPFVQPINDGFDLQLNVSCFRTPG